ncbi:lysophospholipid acyltransferase family protein [Flavobacterium faecale]|uniref:lysophospholipid acyltransferase family protein n=1 Tax=Flavobacterium faecale TaxID=1355330 RepID=UPI003AB0F094
MQFFVFILAYPLLWLISILPFRIFYFLSDLIYLIVYYVVGYRKQTVRANIALALPHLNAAERLVIEKKSYHHLCDMFLEMVKTMTISPKEMDKRFVVTNFEVLKEYEKKGKSLIILASHYASWEWLMTVNAKTSFNCIATYKRISNKHFDELVRNIRSKYGTELVVTRDTIPLMAKNQREKKMCMYGLASDQSPRLDRIFHYHEFMGVEVPVHTGAEMLARKYDLSVVFVKVKKVKRGYYEATFVPISEYPKLEPEFKITHDFIHEVEKQIKEAPEYYFWTHKRWKHRKIN